MLKIKCNVHVVKGGLTAQFWFGSGTVQRSSAKQGPKKRESIQDEWVEKKRAVFALQLSWEEKSGKN